MASELRQRFEDYMTLRNLSPRTHEAYIGAVTKLSRFYKQSPDQLSNDDIQKHLLYLIREKKFSWNTVNVHFSAYRCFYRELLKWEETKFHIPPRPRSKQLPMVMPIEDVYGIIDATSNLKHRTLLLTTYTAGLRVSEVVNLRQEHIESERMPVRVDQGKGRKDRYTILAQTTLDLLEAYWLGYQPGEWLFFGRDKTKPMPVCTAQKIYYNTKKASGITKGMGIHTLRHCFATHHLEHGTDIYTIKNMMGHKSLKTTLRYLHVAGDRISKVKSPMDTMRDQVKCRQLFNKAK